MRDETEIREQLERIEESLENRSGHDMSNLIGQRNILLWVLNGDETGGGEENCTGQSGGRS